MLRQIAYTILIAYPLMSGPAANGAQDYISLRTGEFKSLSGFTIEVRAKVVKRDGYDVPLYQIEARRGVHFLHFYLNTMSAEVTRTPYSSVATSSSNGSFIPSMDFKILSIVHRDSLTTYAWAYGSWRTATEQFITMTVDETGMIRALAHELRIAKGLPSGWHSGPFKELFDQFNFERLIYESEASQHVD